MKIFIDIGHPAHVHYFKNFIKIMKKRGHEFLISSRNKEIEHYLLRTFNINYKSRGVGEKNIIGKLIYLIKADILLLKYVCRFKPDILLSFDSVYLAQVGKILKIPHIAFDDTEHAKFEHLLSFPFISTILTPNCYKKDLGPRQIRFNGYMELCYLHPNYFTPDPSVLELLGIKKGEKYVIMRFVSWNASHDVGQSGLSLEMKRKAVKELSKYAKVFISSEGDLPEDLKKYQIKIPPEKMHDALAFASLFIGESGTMATESAILGTPSIYVNSLDAGVFQDEVKYGLLFSYRDDKVVVDKSLQLIKNENIKQEWQTRRERMLKYKIDVTVFMVWFVENYPESAKIMKENPDYQNKFK